MSSAEPEGDFVTGPSAIHPSILPADLVLGQDSPLSHGITLLPLRLSHAPDLYINLCGPSNDHLHTYLPNPPFTTLESFTAHLQWMIDQPTLFPFTIFSLDKRHLSNQTSSHDEKKGTPISLISLLNITPANRSIEIGHVLFARTLQRTAAATAVNYLLMKLCFEDLHFQRLEWKCNSLNEPSKRAALRLGYKYEGCFRKHMIVKGRRRDTAWYSVVDEEWFEQGKGGVKRGLEGWLGEENFDEEGRQRRKLEEVREG